MGWLGRPSPDDELRANAYRDWVRQRNLFAIASLVLGVFSVIEAGILVVPGIAGIVLGVVALVQLNRVKRDADLSQAADVIEELPNAAKPLGHRLAWTGIALSAVSLVMAVLVYARPWSD